MLSALVEENGLKSWLTGPDGLLSITSVEEVPELVEAVELDELDELHAPSASAPTAHSVAAIVVFSSHDRSAYQAGTLPAGDGLSVASL